MVSNGLEFQASGSWSIKMIKKKKKLQIGIYAVLKNYKYTKSIFLNTLRDNHLSIKTKTKTKYFFLILGWLRFFFLF